MKIGKFTTAASMALLVALTGACSTTKTTTAAGPSAAEKEYEAKLKALQEREAALRAKEAQLSQQAQAAPPAPEPQPPMDTSPLLPPNAKPGECYARIWIPPKFKTVTEKVLARGEGERLEIIPAKYETTTERILVREETERLEVIPATYKTVTERVLVKEASVRLVPVPAKYKTVTEKVLVQPGYTTWKKGRGPIQRIDEATGEIMCLIEVPPKYKIITKRVMVEPPTTKEVRVPPVYKTITKKVVDKPAQVRRIKVPAVYKTVKVVKMVEPPKVRRINIPPVYKTITKRVKVSDGRMEWREILCETNTTRAKVMEIQRKLKALGLYKGPIDGVVGHLTIQAVQAFQRKNGLPVSRYLTVRTLEALGVNPK